MDDFFDRLRTELDQLGDRVKDAVESSKLHLERSGLVGKRSKAAYKLGMLIYKKERGGEIDQAQIDALFVKMDDITAKIAELDRQIDDLDGESCRVDEKPAPPTEEAPEVEVSEACSTSGPPAGPDIVSRPRPAARSEPTTAPSVSGAAAGCDSAPGVRSPAY
jgi:hypothetical protein